MIWLSMDIMAGVIFTIPQWGVFASPMKKTVRYCNYLQVKPLTNCLIRIEKYVKAYSSNGSQLGQSKPISVQML